MRGMIRYTAFLLIGLSGVVSANPVTANMMRSWEAMAEGRYLEAIDRVEAEAFDAATDTGPLVRAMWTQNHSFIGGLIDPRAIRPATSPIDPEWADRYRRAKLRDALDEIVARARLTNIVILNEHHASPRDRAFGLAVARALRPLGYDTLAAETFTNYVDHAQSPTARLAEDGFPRLSSGTYLMDPVFGDFVRQALAMGYRPVAYESTDRLRDGTVPEQIAHREQMQADYLVERIFRDDPGAKVLIFVGHGHVAEEPVFRYDHSNEWMAARLKRMTGIDPLTIDQTVIDVEDGLHAAYVDLLADRMDDAAVVPYLDGAPLTEGDLAGAVDIQVVHPPLRLVEGRPAWMLGMERRPVPIPSSLLPREGRRLVQAFVEDEPEDAIPLDQIVVEAGQPAMPLMLPEKPIRYAYQDAISLDSAEGTD